jgi:CelD/BcsL family acetyltransferase involved in cellulose biosynthesis
MPPYKAYCDLLVRTLARHDKLYLCFLELEEGPIAGSLFYVENGIINEMKTGYSVRYKDYSPSNILLVRMVRHLLSSMPEIGLWNTYPGSYGYKEKYTHARESFITFVLPNRTLLSRLVFSAYRMKMRYLERKRSRE